jgi:hypothetical protein
VQITAHDVKHNPLNGVTVHGQWNGTGPDVTCVTGETGVTGICTVVLSAIPLTTRMVSYGVNSLALTGYVYKMAMNHDPDGSSNGYSITVKQF